MPAFSQIRRARRAFPNAEKTAQHAVKIGSREERMRTIGHFIGGREVKGTSGRFADGFEPMTGDVQPQVALASKAELRAAVQNAPQPPLPWHPTHPHPPPPSPIKF